MSPSSWGVQVATDSGRFARSARSTLKFGRHTGVMYTEIMRMFVSLLLSVSLQLHTRLICLRLGKGINMNDILTFINH